MTTRLSTKGQLIIPKDLRDHLGWGPGSELSIQEQGGQLVIRLAEDEFPETTVRDLLGSAGYTGPRRSLEDMEAAIARGARESR